MSYEIRRKIVPGVNPPTIVDSMAITMSLAECEGAARSIGWVHEGTITSLASEVERANERIKELEMQLDAIATIKKHSGETKFLIIGEGYAIEKEAEQANRIAELERELTDAKNKLANEELDNTLKDQTIGNLTEELAKWRAKFEAVKMVSEVDALQVITCSCGAKYRMRGPAEIIGAIPLEPKEKLTNLTHAEAERLMRETPGRVAWMDCGKDCCSYRFYGGAFQYKGGKDGQWVSASQPWISTFRKANWSIEPLAPVKEDDGLVRLGDLDAGAEFRFQGETAIHIKAHGMASLKMCSLFRKDKNAAKVRISVASEDTRVRRVEGPK